MKPETKKWLEKIKEAHKKGSVSEIFSCLGFLDLPTAITIIERQDEVLGKALLHINKVLDDSESRPGGWGPDVTCVGYLRLAKEELEEV